MNHQEVLSLSHALLTTIAHSFHHKTLPKILTTYLKITIAHSFHHKTLPKIFDNLFKYLKTSHSCNTRIRSNQNFFKPSVVMATGGHNTNQNNIDSDTSSQTMIPDMEELD